MSETRQRILDTARALFNERGLHRVGVRDIARATDMSPGNLAYHFRTKDDLVSALILELHERNARDIFTELPPAISLSVLYRSAVATMRNILRYRFVLLSYVDAVMASPKLLELEAALRIKRRRRHDALIDGLVRGGYLDRRAVSRARYLDEQGQMISSGWLRAAELRGWHDDQAIILHYAKVGTALLEPYCTPKGAREMRKILAGAFDEDLSPPAAPAGARAK
ncbi:TetR/AcrR family transcriptional regulator [Sorangium sp. So ce1128]